MKKLLSVFLCIVILITTCLCGLGTLASEGDKNYNLPSSWGLYKTGNSAYPATLNGNSLQSWMFAEDSTVTYNKQNSLSVSGSANIAVGATELTNLTEGKEYILSFKYYIPSGFTAGSQRFIFKAGIYKKNAPLTNAYTVDSTYTISGPSSVVSATGTSSGGPPIWDEFSLTFTAQNENVGQMLGISFLCGGWGTLYFADIKVEEKKAEAHSYLNPAVWGAYKTGNTAYPSKIDGTSIQNWLYSASEAVLCKGQKSLAISGNANIGTSATKLLELTVGEKYELKFKYYIPENIKAGSGGYIFKAGVYAKDAPLTNAYTVSADYALSVPTTVMSSTGTDINGNYNWEECSIIFTAEEEQYLTLSFLFSGTNSIYISNVEIALAPKDYYLPESWGVYKGSDTTSSKIDNTSKDTAAFKEVIKANSAVSRALKISANNIAAATKLEGLKEGKRYTLSFKYFVPASHSANNEYILKLGVYKENASVSAKGEIADNSFELTAPTLVKEGVPGTFTNSAVWKDVNFTFIAQKGQYLVVSTDYQQNPAESEDFGNIYLTAFSITEMPKAYDKAEDFGLYKNGNAAYPAKIDGSSAHSWMFHSDESVTFEGKASVRMDISSNVATAATKLEDLTVGKKYKVSFKYYIPDSIKRGVGNYIFKAGIYKKDAPVAAGGLVTDASFMLSEQANITASTGKDVELNPVWKTASLIFDAESEQYLGLSFRYAGEGEDYGNVYIADVKIREVLADKDYEAISSWNAYRNGANPIINGGGVASLVSENTVTYNGGAKSVKINKENLSTVATNLRGLEAGKKYFVSFKYYINQKTAKGSGGYIFKVGVYKQGARLTNGVDVSDIEYIVASPTLITAPTGEDSVGAPVWEEFVTSFTAGEDELYLGIGVRIAPASGIATTDPEYGLIYIDDFVLYEANSKDLGEPEEIRVVDFEDTAKNYITSKAERFEILSATNYAGQTSKMLYYKSGNYVSDTEFNRATILTDNDDNFTFAIRDDKVYKLSLRYKIASGSATEWLSFYTSYNAFNRGSKGANLAYDAKRDTWLTYEAYVSPEKGQDRVSVAFELGISSNGVWIDDITLTETDLPIFKGHNLEQGKYVVNFDDYCVSLDNSYLKVESAPARDGVSTNALHIPAITSNSAVTLNDYSVANKSERVFAFPVEPNTRYNFSFWVYTVSAKPSYFGYYYNYNSKATTEGIIRLHNETLTIGGWQKFTQEFTTAPGQTVVYSWFNAGNTTTEMWIDDVILERVPTAVLSETDLSYCEDIYNLVAESEANSNLLNGVSGVYEIAVPKGTELTFTVKATGSGKITLSADGVTPMLSFGDAPSSVTAFSGAVNKNSFNLFTGRQTKIYVIVENSANLKISELMLFRRYSAHGVGSTLGYTSDPNGTYVAPTIEKLQVK